MNQNELYHHGILGQKWGVRRYQNYDGTLKAAGRKRYSGETLFVSGSSKTQDKNSEWYRKSLPTNVKKELKKSMRAGDKIIVGDAPGIDRQVQDFLKRRFYKNVEVYGPGKQVRYSASKKWKTNPIDDPDHPEGSKEWLAKKDKAMTDAATKGLAVVIPGGASATRNNAVRLIDQYKDVKVYELVQGHTRIKTENGVKYQTLKTNDKWSKKSELQERYGLPNKELNKVLTSSGKERASLEKEYLKKVSDNLFSRDPELRKITGDLIFRVNTHASKQTTELQNKRALEVADFVKKVDRLLDSGSVNKAEYSKIEKQHEQRMTDISNEIKKSQLKDAGFSPENYKLLKYELG